MAVGEIFFLILFLEPSREAQPRSLDGEATASRREQSPRWPRTCGKEKVFGVLGELLAFLLGEANRLQNDCLLGWGAPV